MREVTFNHLTVIPIFEHKRESALSKLKLLLFMNEYILYWFDLILPQPNPGHKKTPVWMRWLWQWSTGTSETRGPLEEEKRYYITNI